MIIPSKEKKKKEKRKKREERKKKERGRKKEGGRRDRCVTREDNGRVASPMERKGGIGGIL